MSDSSFLKYLINEDLYDIKEEDQPVLVENIIETPIIEKSVLEEPKVEMEVPAVVENKVAPQVETPQKIKLSDNKVLVVFDNANSPSMLEAQSAYLEKILSAVKLKMDQVDLCHISESPKVDISGYRQIISFTPKYNEITSAKYAVETKGESKTLLADDLSAISASVDLRKQLWEALKLMFSV